MLKEDLKLYVLYFTKVIELILTVLVAILSTTVNISDISGQP